MKVVEKYKSYLIKDLASNLIEGSAAIVYYEASTILCIKDNLWTARNIKFLLYLYDMICFLG